MAPQRSVGFMNLACENCRTEFGVKIGKRQMQQAFVLFLLFCVPGVAQDRLRGRDNVSLRFGDATRILPAEVRRGDLILIDGPKGFRGLRLALRLLATGRVTQVFVHDCAYGTEERAFLDAHLRGPLYSDSIEFARVAHVLDAAARGDLPSDRRFEGERPPRAYGYGLACIPFDPAVSYRMLFAQAVVAGIRSRLRHRVADHG